MSTSTEPRAGSTERWHCYSEQRETSWSWAGTQNHSTPCSVTWVCMTRTCGRARTALADMGDADGFVRTMVTRSFGRLRWSKPDEHSEGEGIYPLADGEFEEIVQDAWMRLMKLFTEWDPRRGLTFTSYASHFLPLRLVQYQRDRFGRGGGKLSSDPVIYTEAVPGGLESLVGRDLGDPVGDRDPTLGRLVVSRHRARVRAQREMGSGAPA